MSSMFPWQAAPTVNNNNTRTSLLQSGVSNALAAQLRLSSSTSNYKNVNLPQAIPSSTATMNMQFTPINRPAYTTNTINGLPPRTAASFGGSLGSWRQPLGVVRPAPPPARTHQIIVSRVPRPYVPFAAPSGVVTSQPNNNCNTNNQADDVNNRNAVLVQDLLRQISVLQQQQQQTQQQVQPRQSQQQYSFSSSNNANNNSASINMQYVSQPVVSAPAAVPIQQIIQAAAAAAAATSNNNNSNFTQFARTNGSLINNNISNYQTPMIINTQRRQTNFIPQVSAAVVSPPSEATKITTFNNQSGSTTSTLLTSVTLERLQAALNSAASLPQQHQPQQLQHTFASLLQKPLQQQHQRSQQQQQEAKSGRQHATLYQSDQPASLPINTAITNNPRPLPPVVSSASNNNNSINNRNHLKAATTTTTTTTPPKSMRQLVNAQPSSSNNVRIVKSSLGEASTAPCTANTTSPNLLYRTPPPPYNTNITTNIAEQPQQQHQAQTGNARNASPSMAERVAILDAILNGNHSNHEKLALLQHHQRQQQQQQQQPSRSSSASKHGEDQNIMQLAQQILHPASAATVAPVSAPSSATPPLIMNISPTPHSNIISSTKNTTATYSISSCSPVPPSSSNKVVVSVSELQNQEQQQLKLLQQQRRQMVSSPAKKLSPALADLYGVVERQKSYDIIGQTSIGKNVADADLQLPSIGKSATVNFEAPEGPPVLPLGGCAGDGFSSSTSNSKTSSSTTMPTSPERHQHHEQQQQQQSPVGSTSSSSSSVQEGNPILTRMLTRIDEQKDADQALYRNLYNNTTTGSKPSKRIKESTIGRPKILLDDRPAQLTDAATGNNNNDIRIIGDVVAAQSHHDAEQKSTAMPTSQLSVNAEMIKNQQNIVGSILTERARQALTTTPAQQSQPMQQQQQPPPPLPLSEETLQDQVQERYEADEKPQPQPALQHLFRQRQLLLLNDSGGGNGGSRRNSAPTTGIISSASMNPHNSNSSGFYRSKLLAKAGWLEKMLRERLSQSESPQKSSAAQATTTTNPLAEPTTAAIFNAATTTAIVAAENDADSSKNDDKILPTPDLLKKLINDAASKISQTILADNNVKQSGDEISLKRKLAELDGATAVDEDNSVKVATVAVEAKAAVTIIVDDDDDDDVMPLDLSCFRSTAENFSTTNDKKPPQERQPSSAFLNENSTPAPLDFRILGTTDFVPKIEDNEIIRPVLVVTRNNSIASSSANSSSNSQKQFDYFDYNGQVPVSGSTAAGAGAEAEATTDNSILVIPEEVFLQRNDNNTNPIFKRTTMSRATSPIRWDGEREKRSIATQTDENDYKNNAKEEKYSYFKDSSIQATTSPAGRGGGSSSSGGRGDGGGVAKQKARNPLGINGSANQRGKKRLRRRIGGPRGAAGAAVHTRGYTPFAGPAVAQPRSAAAAAGAATSVPGRWLPPPIPKFSMIVPTTSSSGGKKVILPIAKRQRQSKKKQQQHMRRQFQSMLNIDVRTTNADADADDDIYAFTDDNSKFGSTTPLKRKSYDDDSSICTLPSVHSSFSSSTTTTYRRRFTASSTTSSSNFINAADAAAAVDNNNHSSGTIQDIYSTVQDISPPPPPPSPPVATTTTTTTDSITIEIDGMPTLTAENEINFKDFEQQEIVVVKSSLSLNAVVAAAAAASAVEADFGETVAPTENLLVCSEKLDESINRVAVDAVDDMAKVETATTEVYAEKPEDLTTTTSKEAENPRWSYTMEELLPKAPRAVLSLLDNSSMLYFYKQAGPENMHRRNNPYRKYRCLGCDVKFIDRQCLAIHQQRIAFQLKFKCPVCCGNSDHQQLQESASAINNKACCNFNNECTFHEHIVEHLMRNETEILGLADDKFEWL